MRPQNREAADEFAAAPLLRRHAELVQRVWLSGVQPRSLAATVLVIGCVVLATIVRLALGLITEDISVFASYYSATLVATLLGGAETGYLAAGLGGAVAYAIFVPSDPDFPRFLLAQIVGVALYLFSSLVIVWAAQSYRRLLARVREEEARRRLFGRELGHRLKNMLANVQAIVTHSLPDHPELRRTIISRIGALGSTNNLLLKSEWKGASLNEILMSELAPYGTSRFKLSGADFNCDANCALALTLVFHELATNAVKYGALSVPSGRIEVVWMRSGAALIIQWCESGGPAPAASTRAGFGTTLLNRALQALKGSVDMQLDTSGLRCTISLLVADNAAGHSADLADAPLQPAA